MSIRGGGGEVGGGGIWGREGGRFLAAAAMADGRKCAVIVSGGRGGSTAMPRPRGRDPANPVVPRSGDSPGVSGFSTSLRSAMPAGRK